MDCLPPEASRLEGTSPVSRKYLPWHTPRPPLAAPLLLWLSLKFVNITNTPAHDENILLPLSVTVKDLVIRHPNLTLCANNKLPGNYRGISDRSPIPTLMTRPPITLFIVLTLCGDIEVNPGPPAHKDIFPCGWCELRVDWSDTGVCCDQCDLWYHRQCISMTSAEYDGIEDVSWQCFKCKTINCSSFIYNGYNVNTTNSFHALSTIPGDDSVFDTSLKSITSPFVPPLFSSPTDPQLAHPKITTTSSKSTAYNSTTSDPSKLTVKSADNLRVISVNCNSVKGKRAELAHLLHYTDPDVVLMCETKLCDGISDSEFLPNNYQKVNRKDRSIHGGGVMIAAKKDLLAEEVNIPEAKGEVIFSKITLANSHPLYIGCFYINDGSQENYEALENAIDHISNMTRNNPNAGIMIGGGGDFNAPGIDWDNFIVTSECPRKGNCNLLLEILNRYSLTQLQKNPTHRDGNILDLYVTNKPGLVKSCKDIPGISDHSVVVVDSASKARTIKKPPRKIFKWQQADWEKLKNDAGVIRDEYLNSSGNRTIAENHRCISDFFQGVLKQIPHKMSRIRNDLPWLTPDLKRRCRRKHRLYNKAKKTGKKSINNNMRRHRRLFRLS